MWFDSWSDVLRVLLVGPASYLTVVVVLRASGKRTLSKLNAFDLVVTVALGSTLATIFLSKDVSWTEGAVALAVLALLQLVVAVVTSRVPAARSLVTAGPTPLLQDGRMVDQALRGSAHRGRGRGPAGDPRQRCRGRLDGRCGGAGERRQPERDLGGPRRRPECSGRPPAEALSTSTRPRPHHDDVVMPGSSPRWARARRLMRDRPTLPT